MIIKEITPLLVLGFLLSTLTACESSSSGGVNNTGPHSCNIPCLESVPTLDTTAVTSTSGGTVRVTFTLRGDITNVSNVGVILATTDLFSATPLPPAGAGSINSPTQATNSVDITVNAGTATGTYFPWITITAISPNNSGSQYLLNPITSSTNYSYAETVSGSTPTPVVTNFTIPVLQVQ